jgi:hypothetical protein
MRCRTKSNSLLLYATIRLKGRVVIVVWTGASVYLTSESTEY